MADKYRCYLPLYTIHSGPWRNESQDASYEVHQNVRRVALVATSLPQLIQTYIWQSCIVNMKQTEPLTYSVHGLTHVHVCSVCSSYTQLSLIRTCASDDKSGINFQPISSKSRVLKKLLERSTCSLHTDNGCY